jgi:hypothetical protein
MEKWNAPTVKEKSSRPNMVRKAISTIAKNAEP